MSYLDDVEQFKTMMTMEEFASEVLELDVTTTGKIRPPWNPNERTPSCQLYEDSFYCYATGRWGDWVDLLKAVYADEIKTQDDVRDLVRQVVRKGRLAGLEPGDVDRAPVKVREDLSRHLVGEPLQVWSGIDVSMYGLRVDQMGNILVPHRDAAGVYGIKVRYAQGGKGAVPQSQFTARLYCPYGHPEPPSTWTPPDAAVICEGESDAWALDQAIPNARIFALPSGAGSWKDSWIDDLKPFEDRKIYLCFDNDDAGKRARDKVSLKLGYGWVETLKVPALYNDAREAVNAGWKPVVPSFREGSET